MKIDVVTIFPDYLAPLGLSLVGRAVSSGRVELGVHDLRTWTTDRHRTVDDTPYGGGAGMVMLPEPWGQALDAVVPRDADRPPARLVVLTPAGRPFTQAVARELLEEAGVRAWCPDPAFQPTTRYENARGVPRVITWFCLLTESEKPTLREFLFPGGDFLEPAEASTRLSFDEDRRLLETVLAYRAEARP